MIETPSAALLSDELAREVDFFSIGTNDLVQYTMAADRENDDVTAIADPFEPSVLRLINQTIDNAHTRNLPVAVCGEMAADADAVPLLLGLGLDEFSVDPSNIQVIKRVIQNLKYSEAKETALEALRLESASEIRLYLESRYKQKQQESISA
jgi:phosphotransferase system enzyme I (PtsI)